MKAQRFRKKQVEVEAIQWTGENREEVAAFVGDRGTVAATTVSLWTGTALTGDYIVRSEEGGWRVYSPEVFEATCEPVDPQPSSSNEEKLRERLERCVENQKLRLASMPFQSVGRSAAAGHVAGLQEALRVLAALREETPCPTCDDTGYVCAECALPRARCSCGLNGASEDGCPQRCAAQKRFAVPREETP